MHTSQRNAGRSLGELTSVLLLTRQAQGILKDLSHELLQHLDEGTAFIQVSTKMNPRGEIRGRVSPDRPQMCCQGRVLCVWEELGKHLPETDRLPAPVSLSAPQVHVPNSCRYGSRAGTDEAEFDDLLFVQDPEELKKDPHTCFFEGEYHAHGSNWTPHYNNCFSCSCQVPWSTVPLRTTP